MSYAIESFDKDGQQIFADSRETLKEATQVAKYMLTAAFMIAAGTECKAGRVEIRNASGAVIWDWDVPRCKSCGEISDRRYCSRSCFEASEGEYEKAS